MMARRLIAPHLRSRLVDEDDARIEKSAFAGDALEDRIRNDMGDAARIIGIGDILLAGDLLAARHVPQAEFGLEPSVRAAPGAPGDDELRIDHAPGVHFRRHVRVADLLDEACRIDRLQKDRAAEIIGDDAGQRRSLLRIAGERRDRDRHGFELPARADVEIGRLRRRRTVPPTG